jgi:hypothetical protein
MLADAVSIVHDSSSGALEPEPVDSAPAYMAALVAERGVAVSDERHFKDLQILLARLG